MPRLRPSASIGEVIRAVDRKRPWPSFVPPKVTRIRLPAEEALLSSCKAIGLGCHPAMNSKQAIIPSACKAMGS